MNDHFQKRTAQRRGSYGKRQSGAVLLVGLVMLAVAALLGMAAIRSVTLQERMAGGFASRNLSFQTAEAALRSGEVFLGIGEARSVGSAGWYSVLSMQFAPDPRNETSWAAGTFEKDLDAITSGDQNVDYYGPKLSDSEPYARYMVERQQDISCNPADVGIGKAPSCGWRQVHKVNAYGRGITPEVFTVLQSIYLEK